jgi:putative tryptophan/tyrosine transport system substrate-binding protein
MQVGLQRRRFMSLLGGAAAAWPLVARAQQPERVRLIGMLMNSAPDDSEVQGYVAAFYTRVQELGWSDGHKLRIEYRWTVGSAARAHEYAEELASMKPDVILVTGGTALSALTGVTRSIPIVFAATVDPVQLGVVTSLARPGGNATGFTAFERTLATKWLEILKEIVPGITRVVLLNSDNPASALLLPMIESAAPSFKVQITLADAHNAAEIERAIKTSAQESNVGMFVMPSTVAVVHRKLIISLAARHRLPAVYPFRYMVADGGLICYGADLRDQFRRAAEYVDRILKGEKPADLPVQTPVKYELAINLNTAKALGLEVPPMLLARADEVIE